jgi:hypothetical protein
MMNWLGKLLGIENLHDVDSWHVSFAAPWAEGRPALVLFACAAAMALGIVFYVRFQRSSDGRRRTLLAIMRGFVLLLLTLVLAEPRLEATIRQTPRSLLLVLFDGTESMGFKDKLTGESASEMAKVIKDENGRPIVNIEDVSRLELIQKVLSNKQNRLLSDLSKQYRVRAYVMDDEVRELNLNKDDVATDQSLDQVDVPFMVSQVKAQGRATAIGAAIDDLGRRHRRHVAGAIIFSDFDQNAGRDAVVAAEGLRVPFYTVGVGPREVVDLSVELQSALVMKKDEDSEVTVHIRQSGLTGRMARVQLLGRRLGSTTDSEAQANAVPIAPPKTVEITGETLSVNIPFTPGIEGRYLLVARVEPFEDEVLTENNSAEREVTVHDDALKLLFVEYEPTWEWRFIKEVFHRDKLVGREGFRTFLRSADFKVRRTNDLFLETLVQPRSAFFANDVIFLSDVPADMLSDHFQQMLHEYVYDFGGGLVVMAGPRFGPGALSQTKVAGMLPVVVDPAGRIRQGDFVPQFTPKTSLYAFMQLGSANDPAENRKAWANLGRLPWYQPVLRVDPRADVLAVHPVDKCVDNETPQPLIAARKYGKGEVIYLGFNETWRLRKRYGEKYYRQFWGQMINRLGLGRALGAQKRFQVNTDRKTYEAGDKVRLTVEAYNENFQKLDADKLEARLITESDSGLSGDGGGATVTTDLIIPLRDSSFYEANVSVYTAGKHRLLVRDPVTREEFEVNFKVAPVTLERRSAVRDFKLQQDLASITGGKSYELHQISTLAADLKAQPITELTVEKSELWNQLLVLILVPLLLLTEWMVRKTRNMR